jgi:tRNA threonylcarbamoyladenosine biosynthesis protein TsaB
LRVLALDTSLGATAAAIVEFPSAAILAGKSSAMERGHAEALVPMVRDLMQDAGVRWSTLNRIVTTVGPGSFTGLRVAVAAARAFALAHRLPVVGVSTLTAYAAPRLAQRPSASVASAIDARHGAVFFERFAGDGTVLTLPGLLAIADAAALLKDGKTELVGNAADIVLEAARQEGCDCISSGSLASPDIAWVARLGAAAAPETAPALPLYLRAASAVPQANAAILRRVP